MHQFLSVRVVQGFGHRGRKIHCLIERQPGLLEACGQVGAIDVLRDDVARKFFVAAHIVHRHYVWMVQIRDGASFHKILVGGVRRHDQPAVGHLDRHRALQFVIMGKVD